jgi:hypothetical protein
MAPHFGSGSKLGHQMTNEKLCIFIVTKIFTKHTFFFGGAEF